MSYSEEGRRRRRRSKSSSLSTKTRPRHEGHDDDNGRNLEAVPEARPANLDDLRAARLSSLEARASGDRATGQKSHARRTQSDVGITSSGRPPTKAASTGAQGRRKKRIRRRISSDEGQDRSEEYVYQSSRVERQDGKGRDSAEPALSEVDEEMSNPATPIPVAQSQRRRVVRRHTAPVKSSRTQPSRAESVASTAIKPPQTGTATTISEVPRPSTAASTIAPTSPDESRSVKATDSNSKKRPSMLQRMFSVKAPEVEAKVSCLTCGDDLSRSRTVKLPCKHRMCYSCLKRIFKLSVSDPAHMPPRCCTEQHIDVKHVDKIFDDDFKKIFNRKFKEYTSKNRTYCPKKGCGEWIQAKHIIDKSRKIGKCPNCKALVCCICNSKMHKTKECPLDPSVKEFAEIAKQAGWRRCYNCSAMVELKEGCNHMTCRCTAEFCMVCGLKWKSCDCPWFSYPQIDPNGDPIRYQQEMDRRREQEQQDEELARQMDAAAIAPGFFAFANGAGQRLTDNFLGQAAAGRYENAEQAARGLFRAFFATGQPGGADQHRDQAGTPPANARDNAHEQQRQQDQDLDPTAVRTPAGVPVVRHIPRRWQAPTMALERPATEAENDQVDLLRAWAAR